PSATNVYFSNPNTSVLTGATTLNHFPSNITNIRYDYNAPGTSNYSMGIQREIAPSVIAVVQYVGSDGFSQNDDRQINTLPLINFDPNAPDTDKKNAYYDRQQVATGAANANLYRQFPGYSNI